MNPCEFTMAITALANAIAGSLSDDDLALTAEVFSQLGDTLGTIALYRIRCSEHPGTYVPPKKC